MFTNILFDNEKEADSFGKKSMKRGFEHKVIEYNNEKESEEFKLERNNKTKSE